MISTRSGKRGIIEIYPKFIIKKSNDLMIRGGDFYAIWIDERGIWSTDEQDAVDLIDRELDQYAEENRKRFDGNIRVLHTSVYFDECNERWETDGHRFMIGPNDLDLMTRLRNAGTDHRKFMRI